MDLYRNFSDLAAHTKEGRDYTVTVQTARGSDVAVVAPHGGYIEWNTESMARAIAGGDHNLYVFSGTETGGGFEGLHLTSVHFDEPRALEVVAGSDVTLTIHGCRYEEPVVFLSGRDEALEKKLCAAFNRAGIPASIKGHPYQAGTDPDNICNRNRRGRGVQIEFSRGIRDNDDLRETCVKVVRAVLKR